MTSKIYALKENLATLKLFDNSQQTTCSRCKKCNSVCPEFDPVCEKLKKAPFVCNGCNSLQSCQMQKHNSVSPSTICSDDI